MGRTPHSLMKSLQEQQKTPIRDTLTGGSELHGSWPFPYLFDYQLSSIAEEKNALCQKNPKLNQ